MDNAGVAAIYYDGSQFSDMLKIKTGDSSIKVFSQKQQRWGDYMGSQPDWNTIGAVWVEGIYGRKNRDYGNWAAKLKSPFLTSIPASDNTGRIASLYPNPAFQFIQLDFDLKKEDNIDFSIFDLQGRKVDGLLHQHCEPGKNIIQKCTC